MSNGRAHRRSVHRGRLELLYLAALDQPARHVRDLGDGLEVWQRGEVAFVVASVPEDAPATVRDALDRRRRATLTGRCACCGRLHLRRMHPGQISQQIFVHEQECPAADGNLGPLLEAEG